MHETFRLSDWLAHCAAHWRRFNVHAHLQWWRCPADLQQVGAADASPTEMLPWKANQFFILIAFALFNLVGIAVTIGILLLLLDWGLKKSKAEAAEAEAVSQQ